MVEKVFAVAKELRVGKYVLIDDIPCRVVNIESSKPGKHGSAKMRITAIGIFDGQKRSFVHPVSHKVKVPMIDKRSAQVLAIMGSEVQLMDMVTYETFNVPIPDEFKDEIQEGKEIQYLIAMDRKKITRA